MEILVILFGLLQIAWMFSVLLMLSGIQKAVRNSGNESSNRLDQAIYIMSKYDRRDNKQESQF